MKRFILTDAEQCMRAARWISSCAVTDPPQEVIIRPARAARNLEQNSALWAALEDIARQVIWHGQKYSAEDWKDIVTAGWRTQRFAPGIEGGIVALGISTSRMSKADFSELLDYVLAWGAEQGVRFGADELVPL